MPPPRCFRDPLNKEVQEWISKVYPTGWSIQYVKWKSQRTHRCRRLNLMRIPTIFVPKRAGMPLLPTRKNILIRKILNVRDFGEGIWTVWTKPPAANHHPVVNKAVGRTIKSGFKYSYRLKHTDSIVDNPSNSCHSSILQTRNCLCFNGVRMS